MGEEVSAVTLEQIRTAIQAEPSLLSMVHAPVPNEAAIAAALPTVVTLRGTVTSAPLRAEVQ